MATRKGMTRREILTGAAGAAAAASIGGIAGCFPSVGGTWPDAGPDGASAVSCGCTQPDGGKATPSTENSGQTGPVQGSSRVVTIQRGDSLDKNSKSSEQPQIDAVQSMVDAVISKLANGADKPWSRILPNVDPGCARIGLKINGLFSGLTTSPSIVRAIIKNLVEKGGFCAGNILVWDRCMKDLTDARPGYSDADLQGARRAATYDDVVRDANGSAMLDAESNVIPILGGGPGFGDQLGEFAGKNPAARLRLSRVLTEQTDVTINLPVLKAHPESGFTAALKNCYGMFNIPGNFHGDYLTSGLPKIYNIPHIRSSIKLTIADALRVSTTSNIKPPDRGPGRIFASLDPLALDYYALDLMNELRTMKPGSKPPLETKFLDWMENAYQLGLGTKSYDLLTLQANGDVGSASDGGADDGPGQSG